jgi:hypothetical protein
MSDKTGVRAALFLGKIPKESYMWKNVDAASLPRSNAAQHFYVMNGGDRFHIEG